MYVLDHGLLSTFLAAETVKYFCAERDDLTTSNIFDNLVMPE